MKSRSGFTLVEIMIVIAIIGLLASMAILNFIQARQKSQATLCSQFLERIESAKVQAAFEYHLGGTDTPTDVQIMTFLDKPDGTQVNGSSSLCPAGGMYVVGDMDTSPICSLAISPGWHQVE